MDNDRPYLGQQVTYSLRIFQDKGANLSSVQVRYNPPDFAGFWNSQQTRQDEYDETVGTREYRVVEVRTVLFASVVGVGSIEPAVLEVSTGTPGTPGRLESGAVAVEVRPLPVPEPSGVHGGRRQVRNLRVCGCRRGETQRAGAADGDNVRRRKYRGASRP